MEKNRIQAIDQFRGFAILGMVLANYLAGVDLIPPWLKHAEDIGLTVIDLIAPFFIFAIGLSFGLSLQRRLEGSTVAAVYGHFIVRYLALLGIGAIISAGEALIVENEQPGVQWGVLQAIGVAGLLALVVIRLPAFPRLMVGAGLLAVYQLCLDRWMLGSVLRSPHGGLFGALSWGAMLILATSLADLFHLSTGKRGTSWLAAALLVAVGSMLALWVPVSKNRVSASYVLISLGISLLVFLCFHLATERFHWRSDFLQAWGRNPMVLYLLHFLLVGSVYLPGIPGLYEKAPLWLVLAESAAMLLLLGGAATWLKKRRIVVSL